MHGDAVYCVAMLCNFRRPLVPVPLDKIDADVQEPQPGGLSDDDFDVNEEFDANEFEFTDSEEDEVSDD